MTEDWSVVANDNIAVSPELMVVGLTPARMRLPESGVTPTTMEAVAVLAPLVAESVKRVAVDGLTSMLPEELTGAPFKVTVVALLVSQARAAVPAAGLGVAVTLGLSSVSTSAMEVLNPFFTR